MARDISALTTGDIEKILGVAPRTVSGWVDNGKLKGCVPGTKTRRINLVDLISFMNDYNFPRTRLLRFIEDHGATKDQLESWDRTNITEPIGTKNLHFYPEIPHYPEKPDILTSTDIAKLYNCAAVTASKWIDQIPLFGYKPPFKRGERRVSLDNLVRFCKQNSMPILLELENKTPLSIDYPGGWEESQKVVHNLYSDESVRYRKDRNIHEFSIKYKSDGLYIKVEDKASRIYNLILTGITKREEFGKIVHPEHIDQISFYLQRGIGLLDDPQGHTHLKKLLEDCQRKFNAYVLQEIKRTN